MGLFSGIFKGRDAPTNRTSGSAYSFSWELQHQAKE